MHDDTSTWTAAPRPVRETTNATMTSSPTTSSTADAPALIRAPIANRRASILQRQSVLDDAQRWSLTAMRLAAEAKDDDLLFEASIVHGETLVLRGASDAVTQHLAREASSGRRVQAALGYAVSFTAPPIGSILPGRFRPHGGPRGEG